MRLWQGANVIQAPAIEFNREQRSIVAKGKASEPVSTVLIQVDKSGRAAPVTITSGRLSYTDNQRKAHFDDRVTVKGADLTITAHAMDVFLRPQGQSGAASALSGAGKIERIVAQGSVEVSEPGRKASGERLVYTAAEDKFVLTGGPPSIFDAEHGKITGVSLTLFRHDDRVVVEGSDNSPAVTKTRVAR